MGYCLYARNALRVVMTYRHNAFFRLLGGVIMLLAQVLVWRALYSDRESVGGVSLQQMVTYLVVVRFVGIASAVGGAHEVESRLKSGDIAIDLLRPISPRLAFVSQSLGRAAASVLLDGLPTVLVSLLVLQGIQAPASRALLGYFLLATLGALILNAVLQMLVGSMAFWFLNLEVLEWFVGFFHDIFSGELVPLWFLPDWLQRIAWALPFQAMRFTPVAIYLGRYSHAEITRLLAVQAGWIAAVAAAQSLLWKRGLRRIVVHGG
jgi:ABC-2 type transport system permease protein